MAGITQTGQKRLIFIVFPQVRTKMRENGEWGKKHENGDKGKYTNLYPYVYIHTQPYKHMGLSIQEWTG